MQSPEASTSSSSSARRAPWIFGIAVGLVLGVGGTAVAGYLLMPSLMLVTQPSRLDFDQTVATIERSIEEQGWKSPGTLDLQASLHKGGVPFTSRVKIVQLCHPEHAAKVLKTDRYVSSLMPCTIAVWEDDAGQVFISKMNTGLMGKLFGGTIAEVMGGAVAREEHEILKPVVMP